MKIRRLNSYGVSHLIALLVLVVGVGIIGSYMIVKSHADSTRVSNAPVVYLHGFVLNSDCTGGNHAKDLNNLGTVLTGLGYTGAHDIINYYACDTGGNSIQTSGDPKAYFASGAYAGVTHPKNKGGNTNNTDIRHISYQLAWYLYNKYSSKGQTVELVAHSMGGLITSWMLYQIQAHNPLFPPYLYVQDSVTISTPFDGVLDSTNNVSWCPVSTQCTEARPGSAFITELHNSGLNAQGTNGTDWTAIGDSTCDSVAMQPKGTSMDNGDIHKISYYPATKKTAPICYGHTTYLTDTSTALNMPLQYRNPGDAAYTQTTTGPHALLAVAQAIMSSSK